MSSKETNIGCQEGCSLLKFQERLPILLPIALPWACSIQKTQDFLGCSEFQLLGWLQWGRAGLNCYKGTYLVTVGIRDISSWL